MTGEPSGLPKGLYVRLVWETEWHARQWPRITPARYLLGLLHKIEWFRQETYVCLRRKKNPFLRTNRYAVENNGTINLDLQRTLRYGVEDGFGVSVHLGRYPHDYDAAQDAACDQKTEVHQRDGDGHHRG